MSKKNDKFTPPIFDFSVLTSNQNTDVTVSQQALFGRHCVVVGTTGGGKSWTVAKLLEETIKTGGKAIILDATGEYHTLDKNPKVENTILSTNSFFHYSKLTIDDLFFLVTPSGRVQSPKLMEAVRSLKILKLAKNSNLSKLTSTKGNNTFDFALDDNDNILVKANKFKHPLEVFYYKNISTIEDGYLSFDISKLSQQITKECIWDSDINNTNKFGGRNDNDISHCVTLISRIDNLLHTSIYKDIFGFNEEANNDKELTKIINTFLGDKKKNVLRIGFEKVGYDFQAREILANSIAKYLLCLARNGDFKNNPIVFYVDEAHQYLNNKVQDEYFSAKQLDSFDQIAKECRKYGLFLCLATQMPRDIPMGTLSQMGTFIVHRLINHYDKEAIGNASSVANKYVLSFLPVLGEGEAILMGIDFPMPLSIKIKAPIKNNRPDSETPKFKNQ